MERYFIGSEESEDKGEPLVKFDQLRRLPRDAQLALKIAQLVDLERLLRGRDTWAVDDPVVIEEGIPATAPLREQIVNPIVLGLPRPLLKALAWFQEFQRVEI